MVRATGLASALGIVLPDGEFETVAGFVLNQLAAIPNGGGQLLLPGLAGPGRQDVWTAHRAGAVHPAGARICRSGEPSTARPGGGGFLVGPGLSAQFDIQGQQRGRILTGQLHAADDIVKRLFFLDLFGEEPLQKNRGRAVTVGSGQLMEAH